MGQIFMEYGQRYSVYKYDNEETISNAFEWKNKKDKNIEEEIKEVLQYLKEENVKIPEKYKIDFNKKYKYIAKIDDHDDSKLYLIYISDEKRIYVVAQKYLLNMNGIRRDI